MNSRTVDQLPRLVNRLRPAAICILACLFGGLLAGGCLTPESPDALRVLDHEPAQGGRHPAGAPIRIVFDGYLDPEMNFDGAATLTSADVNAATDIGYDPSGPALVILPRLNLRPDLAYQVVLDPEVVRGIDGRRLAEPFTLGFTARAVATPPTTPVDFARDLAPIFERRCGCHGPEPQAFPPLTPQAMRDVPSPLDPDRLLVDPGAPLRSVLLLKVLPDYPQIGGLPMPPDAPPLSGTELRQIADWIEAGAPD